MFCSFSITNTNTEQFLGRYCILETYYIVKGLPIFLSAIVLLCHTETLINITNVPTSTNPVTLAGGLGTRPTPELTFN